MAFTHQRSEHRDGAFMEPSGRNRWQPVANGTRPENGSNRPIRNRWQPTATVSERMVRRGSTVRVRQRALQKRRMGGSRWLRQSFPVGTTVAGSTMSTTVRPRACGRCTMPRGIVTP